MPDNNSFFEHDFHIVNLGSNTNSEGGESSCCQKVFVNLVYQVWETVENAEISSIHSVSGVQEVSKFVCEHATLSLRCEGNTHLNILSASYGRNVGTSLCHGKIHTVSYLIRRNLHVFLAPKSNRFITKSGLCLKVPLKKLQTYRYVTIVHNVKQSTPTLFEKVLIRRNMKKLMILTKNCFTED